MRECTVTKTRRGGPLVGLLVAVWGLSGCLSPIALHRAVVDYDRTTSRVEAELLLLNIARARHHRPVHFTAVSSVAATFDFRVNAGLIGRFGGPAPIPDTRPFDIEASTSIAENPTITIVPISGEEFTKRILRPLEDGHFDFLAGQGFDIDMLLRLMARVILLEGEAPRALFNVPSRPEEYREFRRRLLHLAALEDARQLHIEPITYEEPFPVQLDRAFTPAEVVAALEKGYRWLRTDGATTAVLSRKVVGRIAITNFDLRLLDNEARQRLNEQIQSYPREYLYVDVRPGFPGGDYPLRGYLQLRSFHAILGFVASGIAEERGFPVEPDPRTGPVLRNPARVLEIEESTEAPADAEFAVEFEGKYYSIRKYPISQGMVPSWNQEAFTVLANLFQMTVTDVGRVATPAITIAK